jgi:hypothetical protein
MRQLLQHLSQGHANTLAKMPVALLLTDAVLLAVAAG